MNCLRSGSASFVDAASSLIAKCYNAHNFSKWPEIYPLTFSVILIFLDAAVDCYVADKTNLGPFNVQPRILSTAAMSLMKCLALPVTIFQ